VYVLNTEAYLQILTVPTDAQRYYHEFPSQLACTCFSITVIIRELTPILLQITAKKYSHIV